ncbi:MAG: hypothetical protein ACRELS_04760 [Candidatus Rokuibacteriota bacterium]
MSDGRDTDQRDVFFRLELSELKQVVGSLRRLGQLDWNTLYRHTGFKWEAIRHVRAPNGATAHSLRLSEKIRGIAYRDCDFRRIISLHPDLDSAYER